MYSCFQTTLQLRLDHVEEKSLGEIVKWSDSTNNWQRQWRTSPTAIGSFFLRAAPHSHGASKDCSTCLFSPIHVNKRSYIVFAAGPWLNLPRLSQLIQHFTSVLALVIVHLPAQALWYRVLIPQALVLYTYVPLDLWPSCWCIYFRQSTHAFSIVLHITYCMMIIQTMAHCQTIKLLSR